MRKIWVVCALLLVAGCEECEEDDGTGVGGVFIDDITYFKDDIEIRGATSLAGAVRVKTVIEVPSTKRGPLRAILYLDGNPVKEIAIERGFQQYTLETIIRTDELDDAGAPKYPNGIHTMSVQVIDQNRVALHGITDPHRFENPDRATATVDFENGDKPTQATDASGQIWRAGTMRVEVKGAIYSEGRSATEAKFDLNHPAAAISMSSPHTAGAARIIADATKVPPAGIKNLTIKSEQMKLTLATNQGPVNVALPSINVDNEGATLSFDPSGLTDRGVVVDGKGFKLRATDGGVGVNGQPVLGSITRAGVGVTGQATCPVGLYDAQNTTVSCSPVRLGTDIPVRYGDGFFTVSAQGLDALGNQGNERLTARVVQDGEAPTIASPAVTLIGNGNAQFSYVVNDNLSPALTVPYYGFAYGTGTIFLSTVDYQSLVPFGQVAASTNARFEAPFITSVQLSQPSGLIATLPTPVLNNYIVEVMDHAGNLRLVDVPKLQLAAAPDVRLQGTQNFLVVQPTVSVCNGDASGPACPTTAVQSVNMHIQATTPANVLTPPFASTFIWGRDGAKQRFLNEGTSTQPTSTVNAGVRTWDWVIPFDADGYPADPTVLFAGGWNRDGGLVLSYPATVQVIKGY